MNTLIWILIAAAIGVNAPPVVIANFKDEKSCLVASATLKRLSKTSDMRNLDSICLPAENTLGIPK